MSKILSEVDSEGFYIKGKSSYVEQIVDYKDSPSGKAYIGVAKLPLMKNTNFKFGFQGVRVQDPSRQYLQCNGCGDWFKKITSNHIKGCVNLTTREYKEKSGYFYGKGLVSDETALKLTRSIINFKGLQKYNGSERTKELAKGRKHLVKTREWENRFGSCPAQLKSRLKNFIIENRSLPSQNNRGRSLYKILCRRFGSFGEALKKHGLPFYERTGTTYKYTFPDGTELSYNINQMDGRENLYNMMIEKCPMLTQKS